jgi:hypothetical protein
LFGAALWVVLILLLLLTYSHDATTIVKVGLVGFLFCFLGSILPDIDERHSKIFKEAAFLIFVIVFVISYSFVSEKYPKETLAEVLYLLAICFLVGLAAVLFFYAILPAHRGGIHSIVAGALYAVFALLCAYILLADLWLAIVIAVFGFFAYLSHLLLDRSIK